MLLLLLGVTGVVSLLLHLEGLPLVVRLLSTSHLHRGEAELGLRNERHFPQEGMELVLLLRALGAVMTPRFGPIGLLDHLGLLLLVLRVTT